MTIQTAYTLILRTPEGQAVLSDILRRAYHFSVANDEEQRVLQQFAVQTLQVAGLFKDATGSFPIVYVSSLTGTKLDHPKGWIRRLLGRIFNV